MEDEEFPVRTDTAQDWAPGCILQAVLTVDAKGVRRPKTICMYYHPQKLERKVVVEWWHNYDLSEPRHIRTYRPTWESEAFLSQITSE